MSDYVVLRLKGDGRLWLVDFERGRVTPVDEAGAAGSAPTLATGEEAFRGVDLAVRASARREAASQKFWAAD